ncbi:MAG: Succinate dehydrogenase cytochrome b558 subunit [Chlamydiae bacterium]|nr:Succinate dehydrogenase cytochrome b558 subunit [Chlamydiota bacterium]
MTTTTKIPWAFIWRRLHSLSGLWLVIFLIEHLLTNSQAALLIGDDGSGFVQAVNLIKSLPYLPAIEVFLLGMPILTHLVWGIVYLRTGRINSFPSNGTTPSLGSYGANQAYTWQRITSWVLVFMLIGHIVHMRVIEYPSQAQVDGQHYYMVRVNMDEGLYTLAERIDVQLFDQNMVQMHEKSQASTEVKQPLSAGVWSSFVDSMTGIFKLPPDAAIEEGRRQELLTEQKQREQQEFVEALKKWPLSPGQGVAVAPNFGTAELLVVRETFKMPIMLVLYTILVLAACYHGFNGLWTFLITWGVSVTERSQRVMRKISTFLMIVIAFLGLVAVWGSYWINLKQ